MGRAGGSGTGGRKREKAGRHKAQVNQSVLSTVGDDEHAPGDDGGRGTTFGVVASGTVETKTQRGASWNSLYLIT